MLKRIVPIISLPVVAAVLTCCAPTKNTPVTRGYHNLTSRYNVYYNGNEAYKSGMQSIYTAHNENFAIVLPVFVYSDKEAALTSYSDMNRVIEKCGKCVRKHSITVKPKNKKNRKQSARQKAFMDKNEYVKWIDDADMLTGKAKMIKQDYYAAIEQFTYIVRQYDDPDIKTEAYIWLARCYTEMEKYDQAVDFVNTVSGDMSKVSKRMRAPLAATHADILLRQGQYTDAIPFVEEAVKYSRRRDKQDRVRLMYILAQLYKLNDENNKATQWFQKVVDANPDYQYIFNARINMAGIYNRDAGSSEQMQRDLIKMLKDDKNTDYADQIYYALGNIAYNEMRDDDAIWYFKQSVAASTVNNNQKSLSYLAIADICFDKPDYRQAQLYYDSAMVDLPHEYPDYQQIRRKAENLNELVQCLNAIHNEDSLQQLARLSEAERNSRIDARINEVVAEEQAEKTRAAEAKSELAQAQQMSRQNTQAGGKWYFYNPSSLSLGQTEFKKKWGNRKLEDNWRRSNKTALDWDELATTADGTDEEADTKKNLDPKSRDYYLADIPLTDSAFRCSEQRLQDAYFNLGVVYKDKFADYPLAANAFNDYIKRYPQSEKEVSAWFNLYKSYLLQKEYADAERCKQHIISNFPDTDYARILSNPDYYKELEKIDNQLNFMYQATYRFYLTGECDQVATTFAYVDSAYPESSLIPKFELLNTLCQGRQTDSSTFEQMLGSYIKKYPKRNESQYAREIIEALNRKPHIIEEKTEEQLIAEQLAAEQLAYDSLDISLFSYDATEEHYYIVAVLNSKLEASKIRFGLIDFNDDYFDFLNFNVSSQRLNDDYSIVIVDKFRNAKMAQNYIESVIVAGEVFDGLTSDSYKQYIISKQNYNKLLDDKNIDRYNKFFDQNYHINP